jgi:hypothetical protein
MAAPPSNSSLRSQEHQRTLEKRKELLQKQADKALADARERNKKGDKKGVLPMRADPALVYVLRAALLRVYNGFVLVTI